MEDGKIDWLVIYEFEKLQDSIEGFIRSGFQTKFIIFPEIGTFDEYLDVGYFVEDLNEILGYSEDIKVVHFHPEHLFEGLEENDAVNFSNRSPFPMLQLLREADLEALKMTEEWKEKILDRNAKVLRNLGYKNLLKNLNEYRREN